MSIVMSRLRRRAPIVGAFSLFALALATAAASATAIDHAGFDPEESELAAIAYLDSLGVIGADVKLDILADQGIVSAWLEEHGLEDGVDADFWFAIGAYEQLFYVRSTSYRVSNAMQYLQLSDASVLRHIYGSPIDRSVPESVHFGAADYLVAGSFIDVKSGTLVIEALDISRVSQYLAVPRTFTGDLRFTAVDGLYQSQQGVIRGGMATNSCTVGFAATRNGVPGFVSAAHCTCTTRMYFSVSRGGLSTPASRVAVNWGPNADIAFFSTSLSGTAVSNTFFGELANSPTTRSPASQALVGNIACSRGSTSGWRCGGVMSNTFRPGGTGRMCNYQPCNAVFIQVGVSGAGGDSGGPWVVGNSPVGIHSSGLEGRGLASRITFLPSGVLLS